MRDIKQKKYDKPTPIQAQGIPIALKGNDVLGCAETGSGKTASFGIPMIQHCLHQRPLRRGDGPMGLVLAPTRELAQQIDREIKDFSRTSRDVRTSIVVGGTNISEQRGELRNGVEIVIATPGRFLDHLQQNNTSLNRVSYVVLDEADRMLDMGFEPQIKDIMLSLPTPHQTLLFSATMPEEIEALAGQYLNKPLRIKVCYFVGLCWLTPPCAAMPLLCVISGMQFLCTCQVVTVLKYLFTCGSATCSGYCWEEAVHCHHCCHFL